ncbi:ribonuclease inhibitor [Herpetosiphon sp. NSE202]|uniref:ribonuclease inhibitor n=1 Tax=Herpetosiphon sp. NSE202 TaxID=3351349 RepID=UPI00363AD6A0
MSELVLCPIQEPLEQPNSQAVLQPLLAHLSHNQPVTSATSFTRGTVLPDGRLDLCKQQLGIEGCQLVAQALAQNTTIKSLLLGTNGIGNAGAEAVAQLIEQDPTLEIVYLGCNAIEASGVEALSQSLRNNPNVHGLWLKRNPLGLAGAQAIATLLENNQHLRTLDLVNTNLGMEGFGLIIQALIRSNRSLERIYLSGNQLEPEAAELLVELLQHNSTLNELYLSVNQFGDRGAQILAEGLAVNQHLRVLELSSNGIGLAGGAPLLEAAFAHPRLEQFKLGYAPSTKVLAAQANQIGDHGAQLIGQLLPTNQRLRQLDLTRNGITKLGQTSLAQGLEYNYSLVELALNKVQEPLIKHYLERNRQTAPPIQQHADIAQIKSVYRTNIR